MNYELDFLEFAKQNPSLREWITWNALQVRKCILQKRAYAAGIYAQECAHWARSLEVKS